MSESQPALIIEDPDRGANRSEIEPDHDSLEDLLAQIEYLEGQNKSLREMVNDLGVQLTDMDAKLDLLINAQNPTLETPGAGDPAQSNLPPAPITPPREARAPFAGGGGSMGPSGPGGNRRGSAGSGGERGRSRRWMAAALAAGAIAAGAIGYVIGYDSHDHGSYTPVATTAKKHPIPEGRQLGGTVDHAVEALSRDGYTPQQNLDFMFAHPGEFKVNVSHHLHMQSELASFNGRDISDEQMLYGAALSAMNDHGYLASSANQFEGRMPDVPRSDTPEQQLAIVKKAFLTKGMTFGSVRGDFNENTGQFDSTPAGVFDNNKANLINIRTLQITPDASTGLHPVHIKAGGGNDSSLEVCLNYVNEQGETVTAIVTLPPTHETTHPRTPASKPKPKPPVHHPAKPKSRAKPGTPIAPTGGTPPIVVSGPPPAPAKTDTDTTAAGTGGNHDLPSGSTPATSGGEGLAGQTVNPVTGTVGGEILPAAPPNTTTTQTPLQSPPAASGSGETSTDNGSNQAPVSSTGTGTTAPVPAAGQVIAGNN